MMRSMGGKWVVRNVSTKAGNHQTVRPPAIAAAATATAAAPLLLCLRYA